MWYLLMKPKKWHSNDLCVFYIKKILSSVLKNPLYICLLSRIYAIKFNILWERWVNILTFCHSCFKMKSILTSPRFDHGLKRKEKNSFHNSHWNSSEWILEWSKFIFAISKRRAWIKIIQQDWRKIGSSTDKVTAKSVQGKLWDRNKHVRKKSEFSSNVLSYGLASGGANIS